MGELEEFLKQGSDISDLQYIGIDEDDEDIEFTNLDLADFFAKREK